ncbi:hypothetical protein K6I34_006049 [Streptomyces sp. UNOC14_S4]|nr:hypothetical protein [Streptomyces sp. UNOC14_S4]
MPVGFPHTESGARAAAASFATVTGSSAVLTDKMARHRAISIMSTEVTASALAEEADRAAGQALIELRGDTKRLIRKQAIARTGVLSAQTVGFDFHKATVRLWTTAVRGNTAGHMPPKASFQTMTVNLVWEHNDWKVAGNSSAKGPIAPIDVRQATNAVADFSPYVPTGADDPVYTGALGANGFPAPYAHNEQGARGAATSSVMLFGDPRFFVDARWRHAMLGATVAPSALGSITSDSDSTARLVTENRGLGDDGKTPDGDPVVTRTAVLGSRFLSYSDQAASVEVWTASVGGIAGSDETQRPQVAYLRMVVDLTWVEGTWRATSVRPSEPLVPAPPTGEQAAPASGFADAGGVDNAPALA